MDFDFGTYLTTGYIGLLVIIYIVVVGGCWVMTLIGLPGNWIMVPVAMGFDWLMADDSTLRITWPLIIGLLVLAMIGEGLEFLAGAAGVAKKGGSKLSAILALVGSGIGGIGGAIVGLPIPIVGSVVAVIFFASLGALVGAVIGEDIHGKDFEWSIEIGKAAFWGRLLGTLAKSLVGGVMAAVAVAGLVV
jgi:uncharacterized protein YqgC (DUF456 family)